LRARDRSKQPRRSILVVDDEQGIVEVLVAVLGDAGHRALGATNGKDALAKLEASMPELVLLDLEMPVMDGAHTLKALRSDARYAGLPVIMMSGIPESMVKRRCPGADAVLRKPFALDELLATIERLLPAPRAARPARRRSARTPTARKNKKKRSGRPLTG
jgi:CheY-like chemotaxis protein